MSRPTAILLLTAPYLLAFTLIDPLINQPFTTIGPLHGVLIIF